MPRRVHPSAVRALVRRRWPVFVTALSALVLGIFLWQNDLSGMWQSLANADPLLVALALLMFVAHHVVRAARWRMLLAHLHDCGDWLPLRAMTVGVAINNVAPAKAGHFARAHMISSHSPISRVAVGSSFLLEALFDGLLGLGFIGVAVAFVPVGPEIQSSAAGFAIFMLLMLCLAGMVATGRLPSPRVLRPLRAAASRLPKRVRTAASGNGQHLRDGAGALRSRRRVGQVAVTSVVAYTLLAWSFFLLARGLDVPLSFAEVIAVVAVANLATALPGAGGGIGTFEVMIASAVGAMDVADASAAAYAVALHTLVIMPITLLGIAFIVLRGSAGSSDRKGESAPAGAGRRPRLVRAGRHLRTLTSPRARTAAILRRAA